MAERPDIVFVGHVTRDLLPEGGWRPGGSVFYGAHLAARWGFRPGVLTAAASEAEAQAALPVGCEVVCLPSDATTTFRNVPGTRRRQYVSSIAADLPPAALPVPWRGAPALIVPVIGEVRRTFAREGGLSAPTGIALQGWLRRVGRAGRIDAVDARSVDWNGAGDAAVAFVSTEDLAGTPEPDALLRSLGSTYVLVTDAERGARFVRPHRRVVPALPARAVDETGAGDVFAAAFMLGLLLHEDAMTCARLAVAAAAASVEGSGIEALPTLAETRRRLAAAVAA